MRDLEDIIRTTLQTFTSHVRAVTWFGLEREMVSYYALGFLAKACEPGSALYDPGQIGVEVRVPGIPGHTKKPRVCKDLVIWEQPGMTCWNARHEPVVAPMVIMEWKDELKKDFAYDVEWLQHFSAGRPSFMGFTVAMRIERAAVRLRCTKVVRENVFWDWLVLWR